VVGGRLPKSFERAAICDDFVRAGAAVRPKHAAAHRDRYGYRGQCRVGDGDRCSVEGLRPVAPSAGAMSTEASTAPATIASNTNHLERFSLRIIVFSVRLADAMKVNICHFSSWANAR
jgi:hypothetical protein